MTSPTMNCCYASQREENNLKHQPNWDPYEPPVWTIDLSLKPRDRYRKIARHYQDSMKDLTSLFDALLHDFGISVKHISTINKFSRILLRRLYYDDQTEELRGISEESTVPMYLLVAFNVILDLLMGCTSGGVRTLESGRPFSEAKMLHFRTLDWLMDPLRLVVVQLNFIRSKSSTPDQILASSITYVGFVGVLTGVRKNLSLSLNFRGLHDMSTKYAQFRFYLHHLLVLFGRRPSIATYLRQYLTGDQEATELLLQKRKQNGRMLQGKSEGPKSLAEICTDLNEKHTTACYLIFCDGDSTISMDKDFSKCVLRRSQDFIATTNHDVIESNGDENNSNVASQNMQQAIRRTAILEEFFEESEERHKCISDRWKKTVYRAKRRQVEVDPDAILEDVAKRTTIPEKRIIEWVSKHPTTNETTHFATVMDPKEGKIVWSLVYPDPLVDTNYLLDLQS